jgi:hypothetical protein
VGISDSYVVSLAQIVNPQEAEDGPVYEWTRLGLPIYAKWWHGRFKTQRKDLRAGQDSLERYCNASWWEWSDGSRCMHWVWPRWYQETIRDGLKVWFREASKQWIKPQPASSNASEKESIRKKIDKVRKRRYMVPGEVTSLTSFFAVPKGVDDIRVAFDGTKSGLNECIWVPRFPLPTVETLLRAVGPDTYMGTLNIGKCFLNFVLHESLQALGVDLSNYFGEGGVLWERWVRVAFGLRSLPYQACQAVLVAKEYKLGDRRDPKNVFRWDVVQMNLPGSKEYDPSLPWVSKIHLEDGNIVADRFLYVDNGRLTGNSRDEVNKATRVATSRLQKLGIQDAPRKRCWGSRRPGAWAGSIVEATNDGVYVTVS